MVKAGSPLRTLRIGRFGIVNSSDAVLGAADGVAFVAQFVEGRIVDPHVLRELELTNQAGADDECGDAAVHPVVGRALR